MDIELKEIEFELNKENINKELMIMIASNRKDYFIYQLYLKWITLKLDLIYPKRSDTRSYWKEYMIQFTYLYKNEFHILLNLLKNKNQINDYCLVSQLLNELDEIFELQYRKYNNCFDIYLDYLEGRCFNNYNYKFHALEINHLEVNCKFEKVLKKDR